MKFKLVSWNVRGLNDRGKRSLVKSVMGGWNADIICLQETKFEGDMIEEVRQIWGGRWVKYACLEASGTRGGILLLWDSRIWKGDILETSYSVTCKFESQLQSFTCHITGVYAPNCYLERRLVWEEIGAIRGLIEGGWAVCGHFNVVRFISEKSNCLKRTKGMREFSDFIEYLKLIDIQLEDGPYTWFRGDNQDIASRIDRILISEEWDDSFNNIKQVALQRLRSDHTPIALLGGVWNQNKNYFKFENWWLGTERFTNRIKDWWDSFSFSGRPDFILASKLKALKGKLKLWSICDQGNLESKKRNILKELAIFDEVSKGKKLTTEEVTRKNFGLLEYEELLKYEEISWRLKSRSLWLKDGDRNTKLFHKMSNAHKRYNNIDQLVIQGELTQD